MSNTYTAVLLTELDGMQELADLLESIPAIVDFELHPGRLVGEGDQFGEPAEQIPGQTERDELRANALTPEQARAIARQLTDAAWAYPLDGPVLEEAYKVLRDTGALEAEGDA